MSLIELELIEIRKSCENVIDSSRLVTCDESLIRVNINQTKSRSLTACLRFPIEGYPHQPLLVELKSKTLTEKVLDNITKTCEEHCKSKLLGKPHVLDLLKFLCKTLEENPLCICYDEIIALKELISGTDSELKIKQKKTAVSLRVVGGNYYTKLEVVIPLNYPDERPIWQDLDSNFPDVLIRYLNGQAKETVRKCVEPPLRVLKGQPPWVVQPSLFKALSFLIYATQEFYTELCHVCKKRCLPENPEQIVKDDNNDLYVERAFCGHIYHSGCIKQYFCTPPFPPGGKQCIAEKKHARPDDTGYFVMSPKGEKDRKGHKKEEEKTGCGQRLFHDKWALDPKKAEQRWAHKKARERELEEVVDFLQ